MSLLRVVLVRYRHGEDQRAGSAALLGAYRPGISIFVLKNLLGWRDKVEQEHKGAVVLRFDAQDAEL